MYAGYSTGFKSGGFEFRERQIEVHYSGELEAVDTFFVGAMKGIARVYLQTVMDCYSRHAWARLYTSKLPLTAVHILNNDVLPFFDTVLTLLLKTWLEARQEQRQHASTGLA